MPGFASRDIEECWLQMEGSIDRIVELTKGLDEAQLNWRPPVGEQASEHANSLYVLATHAMGSLEENMLFMLAGERGTRDRPSEFASSGATAEDLERRWIDLKARIVAALPKIESSALDGTYTHSSRGELGGYDVIHGAITHAAIHAGHAEMTRDLLSV